MKQKQMYDKEPYCIFRIMIVNCYALHTKCIFDLVYVLKLKPRFISLSHHGTHPDHDNHKIKIAIVLYTSTDVAFNLATTFHNLQ